jgi:hypothetical protein
MTEVLTFNCQAAGQMHQQFFEYQKLLRSDAQIDSNHAFLSSVSSLLKSCLATERHYQDANTCQKQAFGEELSGFALVGNVQRRKLNFQYRERIMRQERSLTIYAALLHLQRGVYRGGGNT